MSRNGLSYFVFLSGELPNCYLPRRMKPYRPSIRRLQLEFAQRLARKRMLSKHRERHPNLVKTITGNSEPWLENPDSIEWGPRPTASSGS